MLTKETLEEAAGNYATAIDGDFHQGTYNAFKEGAKWQAERMYSEEEVFDIIYKAFHMYTSSFKQEVKKWFKQFKKEIINK